MTHEWHSFLLNIIGFACIAVGMAILLGGAGLVLIGVGYLALDMVLEVRSHPPLPKMITPTDQPQPPRSDLHG